VFFWVKTIALYFVTAIFAFLLSLVVSFCAVRAWAGSDDDSPALGILWILLFVGVSGLLLPYASASPLNWCKAKFSHADLAG
jgi:hypothetical protein